MDLRTRLIPCLQVRCGSLVKTRRFSSFSYIGDPANTCRIFNECEVDELAVVDILATVSGDGPNFDLLRDIADECFMPVAYGGGLRTMADVERVLRIGLEKVIIGSAAYTDPEFVTQVAQAFGSQCLVAAIDVARTWRNDWQCRARSGTQPTGQDPVGWARRVEELGVGEILLTSTDREGTWLGLDHSLISSVAGSVTVPVIAHGGANSKDDVVKAVRESGASAVALGNLVVYQKKDMGVLVNFPSIDFTVH